MIIDTAEALDCFKLADAVSALRSHEPMPELTEQPISCPYCGEMITILVDDSLPEQQYVEDCQVCCRPIVVSVVVDSEGDAAVVAQAENE